MRRLAWLVLLPLLGCKEATRASREQPAPAPLSIDAGAGLSCEDRWLAAHDLNEYGDPPGTMYAGGTPLFDERTGRRQDRMEHVKGKHPELGRACRAGRDAG